MSMMYRHDPGEARITASKYSGLLWRAMSAGGLHVRWDADSRCYTTFRLTRDAYPKDERRFEAPTAIQALGRAVREDDRMSSDPLVRLLHHYLVLDYLIAVADL